MSEGAIQRQILDYLAAEHILAFRQNTGQAKMGERFVRFGVKGMADILAFEPLVLFPDTEPWIIPRPVWIEVKDSKGKQSPFQKSFQALVEQDGHRYILVRSLDDVKEALHD